MGKEKEKDNDDFTTLDPKTIALRMGQSNVEGTEYKQGNAEFRRREYYWIKITAITATGSFLVMGIISLLRLCLDCAK